MKLFHIFIILALLPIFIFAGETTQDVVQNTVTLQGFLNDLLYSVSDFLSKRLGTVLTVLGLTGTFLIFLMTKKASTLPPGIMASVLSGGLVGLSGQQELVQEYVEKTEKLPNSIFFSIMFLLFVVGFIFIKKIQKQEKEFKDISNETF